MILYGTTLRYLENQKVVFAFGHWPHHPTSWERLGAWSYLLGEYLTLNMSNTYHYGHFWTGPLSSSSCRRKLEQCLVYFSSANLISFSLLITLVSLVFADMRIVPYIFDCIPDSPLADFEVLGQRTFAGGWQGFHFKGHADQ
uniref:Uncharacterized protein n=1 Tax=Lepeophtheirus salmonis TaxID=72036 RepID=A0A0K2U5L1_LEPSM